MFEASQQEKKRLEGISVHPEMLFSEWKDIHPSLCPPDVKKYDCHDYSLAREPIWWIDSSNLPYGGVESDDNEAVLEYGTVSYHRGVWEGGSGE